MSDQSAARSLDRTSPMPLWAQLLDDLTRRLDTGEFDEAFPGELDLVAEYEVSRHTVREALRRLRERGVLDSTRGRATRVRRGIELPLGSLYSLFREVEARGMEQTSVVLAQGMVEAPDVAARLDLLPGSTGASLFRLERVRLADGEPLAHDQAWVVPDLGHTLVDADFRHTALYDELAARAGTRPTEGSERISAVVPTDAERAHLGLTDSPDVACLRVERIGRVGVRAVEYRLTLVRGDRYTVVADWSARGYSLGATTEK